MHPGAHHGLALAAFAVMMAAGLEVAKGFAVEAAFACFQTCAFGRGLAMAVLGLVAVAYSLTAGLSLMSMTRADGAAPPARRLQPWRPGSAEDGA
jgi:hypothetical protein